MAPQGSVTVVRNEKAYDTSNPEEVCTSSSCEIEFEDGDCAIIAAYPPTTNPNQQLTVDYDVTANTGTYWMIGGIILAVLFVLILGVVGFCVCRHRKHNYVQTDVTATVPPPMQPIPPPQYGAAYGEAPPAYSPQYK